MEDGSDTKVNISKDTNSVTGETFCYYTNKNNRKV